MYRRCRFPFWLIGALFLTSCVDEGEAPLKTPGYVTSEVCAGCHPAQTESWQGSDHDLAMAHATVESVLGDFEDAVFVTEGVQSRFFREDGAYWVETEGLSGGQERFKVKYTFGIRPLQQYLVELPGGRLQALTVAWDTEQRRWFSLRPGDEAAPGDPLHWSGAAMNWNYMCAECHSTGLEKNFDLAANTYATSWAEIDVACESCHGPGAAHVEWARGANAGSSADDVGLVAHVDRSNVVETCAPCHSRRRPVTDDFMPGDRFLDHYVPELLEESLYFPDGQIKDEVFVYGSFLQSRMYEAGVTCLDCHDPHTAQLKIEGNDLCAQCHAPRVYDVPEHLHHPEGSPGAACVDCHMPERTYMVIDRRRDHSFKVPRPDLSAEFGTPNACNECHDDETGEWASQQVEDWYGPDRPPSYTHVIASGRRGESAAEAELVAFASSRDWPAIVRASAVSLLSSYSTRQALDAIKQGLSDSEPMVRLSAAQAMEDAPEQELYIAVRPLLRDSIRAVRIESARVLGRVAQRFRGSDDYARAFEAAMAEFRESQQIVEDRPAAHLNLAVAEERLGEFDAAARRYADALRLDSSFVPAYINLAMLLNRRREALGRTGGPDTLYAEVERYLRMAIAQAPDQPDAHYTLGLLLAEDNSRLEEAAENLSTAARLNTGNARMQYNAGLAHQHLGNAGMAELYLARARSLDPENPDYVNALAILNMQQEAWDRALANTDTLIMLSGPSDELRRQRAWILEQQP